MSLYVIAHQISYEDPMDFLIVTSGRYYRKEEQLKSGQLASIKAKSMQASMCFT